MRLSKELESQERKVYGPPVSHEPWEEGLKTCLCGGEGCVAKG